MIVDWTGTDPQVRGPINATYGVTAGATYNAVFHLTDHHIPKNSGAYRPIRIIAPPGSAVNVVYPGPSVGGNTETHPKLADMVIAALAPALPERVAAAEGGTACNFLFGGVHPKTGDYYANYHLEGGGWGAKSYDDGNDAIIVKNGNCRNTPVEIFETRYPLRVMEYSLIEGSGGPGRMRGGLGTRRVLRVQEGAEVTCNALFDRTKEGFGAFGLDGGGKGGRGAILVRRKGEPEFRTFKEVFGTVSPSKFTNIVLTGGDEVRIDSPGGGATATPPSASAIASSATSSRASSRPSRRRGLRLERRRMTLHATAADHQCAHALRRLAARRSGRGRSARPGRADGPRGRARLHQPVPRGRRRADLQRDAHGGLRRLLADLPGDRSRRPRHRGRHAGALVDALLQLLAADDRLRACARRARDCGPARRSSWQAIASSRSPGARTGRS